MVNRANVVLGWVVAATLASAQPIQAAPRAPAAEKSSDEAAKSAYKEGAADYALGHFRDALAKFELAYKLKQSPTLLFNIAQCHRQLKEFDEAATTYRSFIRLDPQSSQLGLARQLLEQVEAALSAQNAAQTAPPRDANGHDVSTEAKPLATGLSASTQSSPAPANPNKMTADSGHPTNPVAAPAVATTTESVKPVASSSHLPVWIAGGATVAALGAGCAFGVLSKSTASDISGSQHSRAEVDSLQSKLNSQSSTANVLFAVSGGLALVTGALFLLKF